MTFAEHAVAQVLREVAESLKEMIWGVNKKGDIEMRPVMFADLVDMLQTIAQRLSPKPPGEK